MAVKSGDAQVVQLLVDHGARLDLVGSRRLSALELIQKTFGDRVVVGCGSKKGAEETGASEEERPAPPQPLSAQPLSRTASETAPHSPLLSTGLSEGRPPAKDLKNSNAASATSPGEAREADGRMEMAQLLEAVELAERVS